MHSRLCVRPVTQAVYKQLPYAMLITIVPIDKHTCMHTWTCAYMHIHICTASCAANGGECSAIQAWWAAVCFLDEAETYPSQKGCRKHAVGTILLCTILSQMI